MIIAVSGQPFGYLSNVADGLIQSFHDKKPLVGDNLRSELQQVLSDFHEAHVVPYLPLPREDRPYVELLIGYSRNDREAMWASDYSVLSNVQYFQAIGAGKALALMMLETLYRLPPLDLPGAIVLASFVLYRVKERNVFCGNATDIYAIKGQGFTSMPRPFIDELEAAWHRYGRTIEAANLRALLGSPLKGEDQKAEDLRREFERLTDIVRKKLGG